jgi:hypothetical protein
MQLAASYRHKMRKGDVTGAFLQSRPYPDDLFVYHAQRSVKRWDSQQSQSPK